MISIEVVGTFHSFEFTPKEEFVEFLENIKFDYLFLEVNEEVKNGIMLDSYRPEMNVALDWADKKKIPIYSFDDDTNILKERELENLDEKVISVYRQNKINWKKCNQNWALIKTVDHLIKDFIDPVKFRTRQSKMVKNIISQLPESGRVLVLCGLAHLEYFSEFLPNATFPLKQSRN